MIHTRWPVTILTKNLPGTGGAVPGGMMNPAKFADVREETCETKDRLANGVAGPPKSAAVNPVPSNGAP